MCGTASTPHSEWGKQKSILSIENGRFKQVTYVLSGSQSGRFRHRVIFDVVVGLAAVRINDGVNYSEIRPSQVQCQELTVLCKNTAQ